MKAKAVEYFLQKCSTCGDRRFDRENICDTEVIIYWYIGWWMWEVRGRREESGFTVSKGLKPLSS